MIDGASLNAINRAHANFSVSQHVALQRAIAVQRRQMVSTGMLIQLARNAQLGVRRALAATSPTTQSTADFRGNFTIVGARQSFTVLQRQPDCSLTLAMGPYSFSAATVQISQLTPRYDQLLHGQAGLTTPAGRFAQGCADAGSGLGSSEGAYLGKTTGGAALFAGTGVTSMSNQSNSMYAAPINLDITTTQTSGTYFTNGSADFSVFAAGDLNGDGLADAVAIDFDSSSLHIFVANASGTLSAPVTVTLPGAGDLGEAVVIADFNGDGKPDVAVATIDTSSRQEYVSILMGHGDGTLGAPQTQSIATLTAPSGGLSQAVPIQNLIAADIRGSAKLDLLASNGLFLQNDGAGHFMAGAAAAFEASIGTSTYSPNLVAADFDKDGKLDVAVNTGVQINVYKGSGTGSFTHTSSYSSIDSEGYLAAADLDGDGNVDLWVGIARAGVFGGDQSNTQGYALLGNGDGTFQGVAGLPFVYAGGNIADLDGDGFPDAVGVNDDLSLTSYLGDGAGHFAAHATVSSPTSYMGNADTIQNIDSIALADVNGDGKPDLLYVPSGGLWFNGENGTAGLFIALNDGHGGFAAPTFHAVASPLPSGHADRYWTISNLHVADLNQDGKSDLIYNYVDTDLTTNQTIYGTTVQLGVSNGMFGASLPTPYYTTPYGTVSGIKQAYVIAISDLNHDGKPDLVIEAGTGSNDFQLSAPLMQLQTALSHGDGTFATAVPLTGPDILVRTNSVDSVPQSVAVADMNGDGIPDLVVQGGSSSYKAQIAVALGDGDGSFKLPALLNYDAQYLTVEQGIAVGDFNGDGKLDVFVDSPFDPSYNGIFGGNGDGTLQTAVNIQAATIPTLGIYVQVSGPAVTVDLHHDGTASILAGNSLLIPQAGPATGPALAASNITLTASPASVAAGQPVSLTATVSGAGGTPTGTVTFMDGSSSLGSSAVDLQGVASLSVSSLSAGPHTLTASYTGDTTFSRSTSSAVTLTVTGGRFALSLSPASGSISAGSSASTTVSVTPSGDFTGAVALTCSGVPASASCAFSTASVTVSGTAATSTLTINSGAPTAQMNVNSPFDPSAPVRILPAIRLVPALRGARWRRRQSRSTRWIGAAFLCAALVAACGGHEHANSGGTPTGTYTIIVTGTSGSATQTASYSLTVA